MLCIDDPRVRIINYRVNIGERANLNALLKASRGSFFTWQADDDFYDPRYLEAIAGAIGLSPQLPALFTSFRVVRGDGGPASIGPTGPLSPPRAMTGPTFLREYWNGGIRVMGLVGMYRRDYLATRGGLPELSPGPIAVMSEYDLLVRCGLLRSVGYIDSPLVFYRAHGTSWSTTTDATDAVQIASIQLLRRSLPLFVEPPLVGDCRAHISGLTNMVMRYVLKTLARERGGRGILLRALGYVRQLHATVHEMLDGYPAIARDSCRKNWTQFAILLPQLLFIRHAHPGLRSFAVRARARLTGEILTRPPTVTRS
jgi:hypothetical protein